jgi:hypothetical protein
LFPQAVRDGVGEETKLLALKVTFSVTVAALAETEDSSGS